MTYLVLSTVKKTYRLFKIIIALVLLGKGTDSRGLNNLSRATWLLLDSVGI